MADDWTVENGGPVIAFVRAQDRAWVKAGAAAALLHLLGFAVASVVAASPPQTRGDRSVAVTLVSTIPGIAGASGGSPAPSLTQLEQTLGQTEPMERPDTRDSLNNRLSDLLTAIDRDSGQSAGSIDSGQVDPNAHASLTPAMVRIAIGRSLRDRALKCWDRPTTPRTVRVRVTLDNRGLLVGAPKVIGSALDAFDPPQSTADARAVAAVEHCAPYAVPFTDAPIAYDLEFR